jgi:hypothetical protein
MILGKTEEIIRPINFNPNLILTSKGWRAAGQLADRAGVLAGQPIMTF